MSNIIKASDLEEVKVIETGTMLDKLSGVGGIPRGHLVEIFGDPSIGKSSICLQVVAAAQKQGLKCFWADVEFSYAPRYGKELGVDNDKLKLVRGRFAEEILDTLVEEIDSGKWDLVVLDSIGGLTPRAEIEKGAGEKVIGAQANLLARFCRQVVPLISMNNVAFIVINHSFVDLMSGKLLTSGGRKLSYHKAQSFRLKAKQGVVLKSGDKKVGKVVIGEVKKNKLAANEGFEVDSQFIFGVGFSAAADLFADALDKGVITKKGNTYSFASEKLGVGAIGARKALEANLELMDKVKSLV
jgi:recombination protein RecA